MHVYLYILLKRFSRRTNLGKRISATRLEQSAQTIKGYSDGNLVFIHTTSIEQCSDNCLLYVLSQLLKY
jgi:hypothetical protein